MQQQSLPLTRQVAQRKHDLAFDILSFAGVPRSNSEVVDEILGSSLDVKLIEDIKEKCSVNEENGKLL